MTEKTMTPEILKVKKDEEILRLSIDRPSVFGVLVDRYQAPFLRRAYRVLRNHEDAEDAVQEAFTKIYVNAARFKPQEGATFGSWGYRILLNTCFTLHQRRKRSFEKRTYVEDDVFLNLPGDRGAEGNAELQDVVASLLSRLPASLARAMSLHFLMGYREREIAEMEGTTLGAIKVRIFRAKKELRKIYEIQEAAINE